MKNGKGKLVLASLATLILGSAFATAQNMPMRRAQAFGPRRPPVEQALGNQGMGGRFWTNQRMIEQLKITDDQRKEMDQIFYDSRAKLIDLRANLQKAELAMQPLMSADQPDRKAMESQIDKIVAARADLERANARFLLDIRMKLTPEQWKQLQSMRAGMGAPGRDGGQQGQFRNRRGVPPLPPQPGAPDQPGAPNNAPGARGQGPAGGLDQ